MTSTITNASWKIAKGSGYIIAGLTLVELMYTKILDVKNKIKKQHDYEQRLLISQEIESLYADKVRLDGEFGNTIIHCYEIEKYFEMHPERLFDKYIAVPQCSCSHSTLPTHLKPILIEQGRYNWITPIEFFIYNNEPKLAKRLINAYFSTSPTASETLNIPGNIIENNENHSTSNYAGLANHQIVPEYGTAEIP